MNLDSLGCSCGDLDFDPRLGCLYRWLCPDLVRHWVGQFRFDPGWRLRERLRLHLCGNGLAAKPALKAFPSSYHQSSLPFSLLPMPSRRVGCCLTLGGPVGADERPQGLLGPPGQMTKLEPGLIVQGTPSPPAAHTAVHDAALDGHALIVDL